MHAHALQHPLPVVVPQLVLSRLVAPPSGHYHVDLEFLLCCVAIVVKYYRKRLEKCVCGNTLALEEEHTVDARSNAGNMDNNMPCLCQCCVCVWVGWVVQLGSVTHCHQLTLNRVTIRV